VGASRLRDKAVIGDTVLTQNIAIEEKYWVHYYDPENKRQSMEYCHPGSLSVKKFKTLPPAKKKSGSPSFGMQGACFDCTLNKETQIRLNKNVAYYTNILCSNTFMKTITDLKLVPHVYTAFSLNSVHFSRS